VVLKIEYIGIDIHGEHLLAGLFTNELLPPSCL